MISADELLKRFKIVELMLIYSLHPHCRAREKFLPKYVEHLKGIVSEDIEIEILAIVFVCAEGKRPLKLKQKLLNEALDLLYKGVRETALVIKKELKGK